MCLDVIDEVESFDALITDPPYSSGGQYRGDRINSTWKKYMQDRVDGTKEPDFSGDVLDQRVFMFWSKLWLTALRLKASTTCAALIFTDWRQLPALTDAVQLAGWMWKGVGVWEKPGGRPQDQHFAHTHELIVHARSGAVPSLRLYVLPSWHISQSGGCWAFILAVRKNITRHRSHWQSCNGWFNSARQMG